MSWRKTILFAIIPAVTLGGCASAATSKVAVCDGKHRRPVNIHGSVLGEVPPAVASAGQTPAPSAATPARPSSQSKPAKVSAAGPGPLWFPSC